MHKLITGLLILAGVIHLLPVLGVLGAERLYALYGVALNDPNLEIMMRHRAVLFGLLGLFLIYAAFKRALWPVATTAGLVAAGSFIVIALAVGGHNSFITRVVIADAVAVVGLVVAGAIQLLHRNQR